MRVSLEMERDLMDENVAFSEMLTRYLPRYIEEGRVHFSYDFGDPSLPLDKPEGKIVIRVPGYPPDAKCSVCGDSIGGHYCAQNEVYEDRFNKPDPTHPVKRGGDRG